MHGRAAHRRPPAARCPGRALVSGSTGRQGRDASTRVTEETTAAAVVAARKQAPRSLWDPAYTETSWITECCSGGPISLLPRLQGQDQRLTTRTRGSAITEYNYGAGKSHLRRHCAGGRARHLRPRRACSPPITGGSSATTASSTARSRFSATTTAPTAPSATPAFARRTRTPSMRRCTRVSMPATPGAWSLVAINKTD